MKIMIDEEFCLASDRNCWSVKRLTGVDKDGTDTWDYLGYFQQPGNAINCLANYEIRTLESDNLAEAIERVNEIEEKYNKFLTYNFKKVNK